MSTEPTPSEPTPVESTVNHEPLRPLTDDEITAFATDGVVVLRGLLDGGWLDLLAAAVDDDIAHPAPGHHGYDVAGGGRFHGNFDNWRSDRRFARYCLESPLPAVAAQLLDADTIQLFYDQLFVKERSTDSPTPWHNDQPYWPVAGRQLLSLWVTLDPVTADSGALEFVRRSHRWNRWFQPRTFAAGGYDYEHNPDYEPMPDIDASRHEFDLVTWDMEPGDLLAFHALTVHGSGGNLRRDRRRRGYTVRYAGDDVVYETRAGTNPALGRSDQTSGAPLDPVAYPVAHRRRGAPPAEVGP
ncbi:MAG: phytanoyl-CoA dioxygenase family protein [Acidimicrobiales bacterium]